MLLGECWTCLVPGKLVTRVANGHMQAAYSLCNVDFISESCTLSIRIGLCILNLCTIVKWMILNWIELSRTGKTVKRKMSGDRSSHLTHLVAVTWNAPLPAHPSLLNYICVWYMQPLLGIKQLIFLYLRCLAIFTKYAEVQCTRAYLVKAWWRWQLLINNYRCPATATWQFSLKHLVKVAAGSATPANADYRKHTERHSKLCYQWKKIRPACRYCNFTNRFLKENVT